MPTLPDNQTKFNGSGQLEQFPRTTPEESRDLKRVMQAIADRYPPTRVLRRGELAIDGALYPYELLGDLSVRVLDSSRSHVIFWSEPGAYVAAALAPRAKREARR